MLVSQIGGVRRNRGLPRQCVFVAGDITERGKVLLSMVLVIYYRYKMIGFRCLVKKRKVDRTNV